MAANKSSLRILLVDDNPDDRLLVARTLRRDFTEVQVDQVRFAEELAAILEQPPYDLVVTDYHLRWSSGLQVLEQVRAAWPDVPVIMFTATGNEEVAVQAMKSGLDDYVLKSPKHFARLSGAVRGALERAEHRRRAQHAERRYRQTIENSPNPIFSVGPDGTIQTWNAACERIFGYLAEEAIGQPWQMLVLRLKTRAEISRALQDVLRGETLDALQLHFRTREGGERITLSRLFPVYAPDGSVEACVFTNTDITEQLRALTQLEEATHRLEVVRVIDRAVLAGQPLEAVAQLALERILQLVPADYALVVVVDDEKRARVLVEDGSLAVHISLKEGVSRAAFRIPGRMMTEPHIVEDLRQFETLPEGQQQLLAAGLRSGMIIPLQADERLLGMLILGSVKPQAFSGADLQVVSAVADEIALALDRARLQDESARQQEELFALYEAALAMSRLLTREELFDLVYRQVQTVIPHEAFVLVLARPDHKTFELVHVVENGRVIREMIGRRYPYDEGGLTGWVLRKRTPLLVRDIHQDTLPVPPVSIGPMVASWLGVPITLGERLLGALSVQSFQPLAFDHLHLRFLESLAAQIAVALENARLFEDIARRARELEVLTTLSAELRQAQDSAQMIPILVEQAAMLSNSDLSVLYMHDLTTDELVVQAAYPPNAALMTVRQPIDVGVVGEVFRSGELTEVPLGTEDPRVVLMPGEEALSLVRRGLLVPVRSTERILGVLTVGRTHRTPFSEEECRLLRAVAEMGGNAIQRARLHEQTRRDLARMTALHTIDIAITSSMDRRITLKTVAEQCAGQLNVDAVDILLLDEATQRLTFAAGHGFRTKEVGHTTLMPGEGVAGRAFHENRLIHVADLSQEPDSVQQPLLEREGFVTYVAMPLTVKGDVRGVLELFHRRRRTFDEDWFRFLRMLATQAAIAIENTGLFEELRRSHMELSLAYDATLEGWARALEYRDQETEGHTRRVTAMTVDLAQYLGIKGEALTHIRRGVLLHDIGKIAIPDAILLKPGPLTDEERAIMQRHPEIAYEMLSPITFLRPALDIPYYHHEKWDGTGYPHGLKGEEIPLPARIFAVIDVFDALTSDRPYRSAWSLERTLAYLRAQSGRHFDPHVLEAFFAWRESRERS